MVNQFNLVPLKSTQMDEIIQFLHDFPRFFRASNSFSWKNDDYYNSLQYTASICFLIGMAMFSFLLVLSLRRFYYTTRDAFSVGSFYLTDVPAMILLGLTAFIALGGLIAQAEIDYSIWVSSRAIMNISHSIHELHSDAYNMTLINKAIMADSNDMLAAYEAKKLPSEAVEFVQLATKLSHASRTLATLNSQIPSDLDKQAKENEADYFWFKGFTNLVVLIVSMMTITAIAAIGWSIGSTLKMAIVWLLFLLPVSAGIAGIYFSGSIAMADFCVDPANNTIRIFQNKTGEQILSYYVKCDVNQTSPFAPALVNMSRLYSESQSIMESLNNYAVKHPKHLPSIKQRFLDPIQGQVVVGKRLLTGFNTSAQCNGIHALYSHAIGVSCGYGIAGQFSLSVHHAALCFFLFLSVISLLAVWERIAAKDDRMDLRYQLLASYEEDNLEHVYLSAD